MNKLIYFFILIGFFFGSCSNDSEKDTDQSETAVIEINDDEAEVDETITAEEDITEMVPEDGEDINEDMEFKTGDCDEFLDEYEVWANDYIDLLQRFKKNPASPNIARDYNKLSKEYSKWTADWLEFVQCTDAQDYQNRYNEINKKIEQKQAELQGD